ncbi:MAG: hypothetical protein HRS57_03590 [Mycoplasmataceae bacterium]|nr:hypothetical protein [Mycoplasmataceae bacterium]
MRMNLRQIVRNQKLQNFNYNLSDFITEANDEEVEKKDAFAGKTDAKEPKNKYWYVKDDIYKARVNHPGEGWELADKKKAKEAEKSKTTSSKEKDDGGVVADKDIDVDISDFRQYIINQTPNDFTEDAYLYAGKLSFESNLNQKAYNYYKCVWPEWPDNI